jgi:hypothetical protein
VSRRVQTLLFTDNVESTDRLRDVGDAAWTAISTADERGRGTCSQASARPGRPAPPGTAVAQANIQERDRSPGSAVAPPATLLLRRRGTRSSLLRHEGERRALPCLERGFSELRRPNQPHGHRMMSAAWTTMTSSSTLVAEHHMSRHQNVGVPAARSRNRWIASGEEWGSGRGPLSLEPEPSEPASGHPRVSTPSRRREALCDRCAPTHATAMVAANRPTYWSEACSPPRRSQLR